MTTYQVPAEPMLGMLDRNDMPWWRYPDGWRRGGEQESEPIPWGALLAEHGPLKSALHDEALQDAWADALEWAAVLREEDRSGILFGDVLRNRAARFRRGELSARGAAREATR